MAKPTGLPDLSSIIAQQRDQIEALNTKSAERTNNEHTNSGQIHVPAIPETKFSAPPRSVTLHPRELKTASIADQMLADKDRLQKLFWPKVDLPSDDIDEDRRALMCWPWLGSIDNQTGRYTFYVKDANGNRVQTTWNTKRFAFWSMSGGEDYASRIESPAGCATGCCNPNHITRFGRVVRPPRIQPKAPETTGAAHNA